MPIVKGMVSFSNLNQLHKQKQITIKDLQLLICHMSFFSEMDSKLLHKLKLVSARSALLALFFSGLFLLITNTNHAYAEANKIIKWKDANGVTHYGDKLPAQEAGRGNSVLNRQGTVIKQNESFNPNINTADAEKLTNEQSRKDAALLASYSSSEEIDLALARNIKSDQMALQTLHQRLNEAQEKTKQTYKMYAGKKMPVDVITEQKANHSKIIKLQSDIAAAEYSISQTVSRFDGYKARYLELRPRDETLTYIKANKKTLVELEAWKENASNELNDLLTKALAYKRTGEAVPEAISRGIIQKNDEVARADEEIKTAKINMKQSQQNLSR